MRDHFDRSVITIKSDKMESYSKKVKLQLESEKIQKKCCRFTDEMMSSLRKDADESSSMAEIWQRCRCDGCKTIFIRRAFLLYGSVTDPNKSYHLDFVFSHGTEADVMVECLAEAGFDFHRSTRRQKSVLYLKNSSDIEDFLVFIGASGAAFEFMNSKIVHEFRNSVNRQVNCDTANIEKQLGAAKRYIDAIRFLIDSGRIDSLPAELKETAVLRAVNDQLSLADLGNLINPPVSKSGMRHRLDRILSAAEKFGFMPE